MILRKILVAMKNPAQWKRLYVLICSFFINVFKYRNFSLNPNTRQNWNGMLSNYDDFWRDENYHHVLDLFPRDEKFSLLDVGCAIGDGCELLYEHFPQAIITGADISDVGIKKAKKKTKGVEYVVLDILEEPIPEKYDWILIVETLEHFDDPFMVVEKCLKSVNKALIISVPYKQKIPKNKLANIGQHRYSFDEETFSNYNCRVVKITEYVEVTKAQCIIYEIQPG